mgnify:CR=1 FL=1|tara:strand:+ start:951 stop:1109 length:159 start_codon:yes stop_codon:yes gene_type:complete
MPLYEYICNNNECETPTFEVLTSFDEELIERCPDCKEGTRDKKDVYQFDFRM